MSKKYKISYLSNKFYSDYPFTKFPEFEEKNSRPYVVFLITVQNHNFAIPLRTNMNHKYGYRFKNSERESRNGTGLDFTKAVLVDNSEYIGNNALIDRNEYLEINRKYFFIRKKFEKYVIDYKKYNTGQLNKFKTKAFRYSTLKYYNKELCENNNK